MRNAVSISNDTKCMVIKIFPKINYTNFYLKANFHDYSYIKSFEEMDFTNVNKQYIILNYQSSTYFNNTENSIISVMIVNGDDDCYINIFPEINDIYPEDLKNNKGNLINKNYINFNYFNGEKYIFISNFKNNLNNYKIKIINNKEYYDITRMINFYKNFSFTFKFNKTFNQNFTLSFSSNENDKNHCLYFNISSNLKLKVNAFTDKKSIKSEGDNSFKINYKKIYFELMVSNQTEFEEFQFEVLYKNIF